MATKGDEQKNHKEGETIGKALVRLVVMELFINQGSNHLLSSQLADLRLHTSKQGEWFICLSTIAGGPLSAVTPFTDSFAQLLFSALDSFFGCYDPF